MFRKVVKEDYEVDMDTIIYKIERYWDGDWCDSIGTLCRIYEDNKIEEYKEKIHQALGKHIIIDSDLAYSEIYKELKKRAEKKEKKEYLRLVKSIVKDMARVKIDMSCLIHDYHKYEDDDYFKEILKLYSKIDYDFEKNFPKDNNRGRIYEYK